MCDGVGCVSGDGVGPDGPEDEGGGPGGEERAVGGGCEDGRGWILEKKRTFETSIPTEAGITSCSFRVTIDDRQYRPNPLTRAHKIMAPSKT